MTQDIDLCLLCGFGNEEKYIHALTKDFNGRLDDTAGFARDNRVLLLSAANGIPVDISLSGLQFEEEMVNRATPFTFDADCCLITCSAEDLIVLKAFAERPKDWGDVESIVQKQGNRLDIDYILKNLTPLCELKESPEIIGQFQKILENNP